MIPMPITYYQRALFALAILAMLGALHLGRTNRRPISYRPGALGTYRRTAAVVILLWGLAASLGLLALLRVRA